LPAIAWDPTTGLEWLSDEQLPCLAQPTGAGGTAPHASKREVRQRITGSKWRGRHEGSHGTGRLRLGKQTLCQLSYSRSGGGGMIPCAREVTNSEPMSEPAMSHSARHEAHLMARVGRTVAL
jgi:hypothetical protein